MFKKSAPPMEPDLSSTILTDQNSSDNLHQKLTKDKISNDDQYELSTNSPEVILKLRPWEKDFILFYAKDLHSYQKESRDRTQDQIIYMLSNLPVQSINGQQLNNQAYESYFEINHKQRIQLMEQLIAHHLLTTDDRLDLLIKIRLKLGSFEYDLFTILKNLKFIEINNQQNRFQSEASSASMAIGSQFGLQTNSDGRMQTYPIAGSTGANNSIYYNPSAINHFNYAAQSFDFDNMIRNNYQPPSYSINLAQNPYQPMFNPVNQLINQQPLRLSTNQFGQPVFWNSAALPASGSISNSQPFYNYNAMMMNSHNINHTGPPPQYANSQSIMDNPVLLFNPLSSNHLPLDQSIYSHSELKNM